MKKRFSLGEMLGALSLFCALFSGCKAVGTVTEEDIVIRLSREFAVSPAALNFVLAEEPAPQTVTALLPRVSENITLHWTVSPENIVEITPVQESAGRQVVITPLVSGCAVLRAKINEYNVYADCNVTVREEKPGALSGDNAIRKFYVRDNSEIVYAGFVQDDKKTILLELPLSFNLEALRPAVLHDGVSYTPQGAVDFRDSQGTPLVYTVTAANGGKAAYRVTAVRTDLQVVDFLSLDGNGESGVTTTSTLVLRFKAAPTFWLDPGDIQVEPPGAVWFSKENEGTIIILPVKGVKENDIDITLTPAKKGCVITPLSRTIRVYKASS